MQKKKSIKVKLHELIKECNSITYYELRNWCDKVGIKLATAERCLRPSQSPEIAEIRTEKGAIIGYKWRGTDAKQWSNVKDFMDKWGTKPKVEAPKGLF